MFQSVYVENFYNILKFQHDVQLALNFFPPLDPLIKLSYPK
jgi:hypothetical protein